MTAEDHNKTLGILNLAYGGIHALFMLAVSVFFLFVLGLIKSAPGNTDGPPLSVFLLIIAFVVFINLLLTLPAFIAGYGLLKRKSWARTAGIISAIAAAINFPFGTALCVYMLWFLFGEGRHLYDKARLMPGMRSSLYEAPPPANWNARAASQGREQEYVPPPQPPNWRDS